MPRAIQPYFGRRERRQMHEMQKQGKKRSLHALWTHDILLDLYTRHLFLLVVHSKLVRNNPRQTMVIAQELKTCFCSSSEKNQNRKRISNNVFLTKPESLNVLWFFFFFKCFDRVK